MNQKTVKTGMILISYTAILILIVVYFKEILSGIDTFLKYSTPFIIGLVMAFFLNPPYRLFMKLFHKIKFPEIVARLLSTILVLLLAYGVITGIVMVVIPQVTMNFKNFFSNFDEYLTSLQRTLDNITDTFHIEAFDLNLVIGFIQDLGIKIQNSITEWGPQAFTYTKKVISSITNVLIGIIFSIYILNARDRLLHQLHRLSHAVLSRNVFNVLYHIGEVILRTFDNYVVGQVIEAIILGTLCYIGMLSFNFAYPGLISVIVAVTALVPIVGTIVGGSIGFLLYLLVNPVKALIFLIFFAVLQQLENNLIYPKVVGSKIGLPGLWVLFAVMIGSQVGGFLGMLFGVPVFTVIYTLLKDLTVYKEKHKLSKESKTASSPQVPKSPPSVSKTVEKDVPFTQNAPAPSIPTEEEQIHAKTVAEEIKEEQEYSFEDLTVTQESKTPPISVAEPAVIQDAPKEPSVIQVSSKDPAGEENRLLDSGNEIPKQTPSSSANATPPRKPFNRPVPEMNRERPKFLHRRPTKKS